MNTDRHMCSATVIILTSASWTLARNRLPRYPPQRDFCTIASLQMPVPLIEMSVLDHSRGPLRSFSAIPESREIALSIPDSKMSRVPTRTTLARLRVRAV